MSNEIFIVTANDCTHCQTFRKSHLSTVLNSLTTSPKYKDVTTREIHVENMGKKIVEYPEIDQYVGWYPTIIYVKNRSQRNQSVLIFNGEISPTGSVAFRSRLPFNAQNIDKWLTDVHINKIVPQSTPPTAPGPATPPQQPQQPQQPQTPTVPSASIQPQKQNTIQAPIQPQQTILHPYVGNDQIVIPPMSSYACSLKIKPKH